MEKIIKKLSRFEEAEKTEIEFWKNASPEFKLETLEAIRYTYFSMINPHIEVIKKVVNIKKLHDKDED